MISHEQLLALGVTPAAIKHQLASGRLYRYFRGVYAVGHIAVTARGRQLAAVMSYGPEAAISHQTCAWWCGFWKTEPRQIDVTVPGRSRSGQPGIRLHLVRTLDPRDITIRAGVPVTTPERTLLDLAEVTSAQRLRLAIDEADRLGLWRPDKVEATLRRSPGRRGLKPLRVLLSDLEAEPLLRSELEAMFNNFCDGHALPRPMTNTMVEGYEVDAFWPEARLIAELDSREHHLNGRAFEDDRERDAELLPAYHVMRVTYRQISRDPAGVARRIRRALLAATAA